MEKYKYCLIIAYDGANYSGWQIQPNAKTVQDVLEKALAIYLKGPIKTHASGRTDQGVHAMGQVAHFECQSKLDLNLTRLAINGLLPLEIRILEVKQVNLDFHARYSAKGKIYHYNLWLEVVKDPFKYRTSLHIRNKLDLNLLEQAAKKFEGTHDFTTFANFRSRGFSTSNPIKTIRRLSLVLQDGGARLEFEGDGFLYKMVRNISGALLEVGLKKRSLESIDELFTYKDRKKLGKPAPAHALFLMEVLY